MSVAHPEPDELALRLTDVIDTALADSRSTEAEFAASAAERDEFAADRAEAETVRDLIVGVLPLAAKTGPAVQRSRADALDEAEVAIEDAIERTAASVPFGDADATLIETFVDVLRVHLGFVHPYGAHHSAPGFASVVNALPE